MNISDPAAPASAQVVPRLVGRPLVALLPFVPCGRDTALRRLGNEIAERLRERLLADPALGAILISSEFLAAAPVHALELICRELRVGHLISGKCHATGGEPSLYVELTDARDWHVRWAEFYRFGAESMLADDGQAIGLMVGRLRDALGERRWR